MSETGDSLADWVSTFLADDGRADVRTKLSRSGAANRHVLVVLPGFAEAPHSVTYLLMSDSAPLPLVAPVLPDEVTHVWLMSTWAEGRGMRWSPEGGWADFDKFVN